MGYKVKRILVGTQQVRPVWKPNANTIAYYPLTDNFNDYMGNYNMATKAGSPSITTLNGVKCCYFNGSSDIGNNDFHQSNIGSTFTICGWINTSSEMAIFTNTYSPGRDGINCSGYAVGAGTSWGLSFGISNGSSQNFLRDENPLSNGVWHHICFTYSNNTAKGYRDGDLTKTVNNIGLLVSSNGYARIGGYNDRTSGTGERYFSKGYTSNIIIENKVRTDAEINLYYRTTKSNYGL